MPSGPRDRPVSVHRNPDAIPVYCILGGVPAGVALLALVAGEWVAAAIVCAVALGFCSIAPMRAEVLGDGRVRFVWLLLRRVTVGPDNLVGARVSDQNVFDGSRAMILRVRHGLPFNGPSSSWKDAEQLCEALSAVVARSPGVSAATRSGAEDALAAFGVRPDWSLRETVQYLMGRRAPRSR
jgi:hypothetical protein